jgi:antitoxin (DNA-binding transcriptional repressor) of toxin-antitoxin stability system
MHLLGFIPVRGTIELSPTMPDSSLFGTPKPTGGMKMTSVTIEEAQAKLKELIHQMSPGEELIITENRHTVAKLVSEPALKPRLRPGPGLGKGMLTIVSEDDEHLADFAEYMP